MTTTYDDTVAAWRPLLEEVLADYPLPAVRVSLVQDLVNTSFRLQADGVAWYLRLYARNRHRSAELISEAILVEALGAAGANVPTLHRTRAGAPVRRGERHAVVFAWLTGTTKKEERTTGDYAALGELLGRVHGFVDAWTPPAEFARPLLDPIPASEWLREIPTPLRSDLMRVRERWEGVASEMAGVEGTRGLIHADPSFGNVLFQDRRPYLIDFDDCALGFRAYDLAVVLAGAWGRSAFAENRAALLRGYRSVRPLSENEETALPVFMAGRAASLILWLIRQDRNHPWLDGQVERLREFLTLDGSGRASSHRHDDSIYGW